MLHPDWLEVARHSDPRGDRVAAQNTPRRERRSGARPPDAAAWVVESWKDWAKSIALEPLAIERTVYCQACGFAGTLDLYAPSDLSRSVPPERRVSARGRAQGLPSSQGLIVRVHKLMDDPSWEVMAVPAKLVIDDFLAAARLWRWQRQMEEDAHR